MLKVQISFAPNGRTFREGFGDGLSTSQGRGCSSGRKPPLHGVIVFHFFGEFVLIYDCVLQKKGYKMGRIVNFFMFLL